ncbi:MAG TPA: protein translocase subunit SecD [Terracidiphilus sp.]|nr:protein translocase subunit SecD [Terracidiphilus sp.]
MKKNLRGRILAIIAVLLIAIYGMIGIPSGLSGKAMLEAVTRNIHLGLDLKGGAHLILQVVVSDAINAETDNMVGTIQQDLRKAHLTFSQVYKPDPKKPQVIRIEGAPQASASAVRSLLDSKYSNEYDVSGGSDNGYTLTLKPSVQTNLEGKTVQQAIETIRDRVDSLGVSEPVIQEYGLGANQILVELPGIDDLDRVKSIIQSTARLSIHAVVGGPFPDEQAALSSVGGNLPSDQMMVHGSGAMASGSDSDSVYILQRVSVVAGNDFRSADPSTNQNTGQRIVIFTLTNEAGDKFYEYTSQNVGRSMAVVLGGRVREVASIKSAIRDRGEIEGTFTEDEVSVLSKMLRTGALPASLEYLENRTVGASLGADSVKEGVTAAVVGVMVVMIFMLVYYRGSGVNADIALILNLLILLGFMGYSKATLTLPGIAGVILTIGMGVDSNVLIFERIREEIRAGKAASAAVDQGFAHAWVTIVDTHVTTIVSAAILFLFGTGPVKGFATTLTFGLLANLFTAVFVSRVIFDAHLNKMKPGELVSI